MIKYIFVVLALIAGLVLFFFMYPIQQNRVAPVSIEARPSVSPTQSAMRTVTIGTDGESSPAASASPTGVKATVQVEVESTEAAREQGLSGRTSLAEGSGMLFIFQQPGTYGFWMKDMQFALDMIFADAQGKIVTIDQNLSPNSYNAQNPQSSKVFYPSEPIVYVLEVPAGFAAGHSIKEGMVLQLK